MSSTIIDAGHAGAELPRSAPPPAAPSVPLTGFAAGATGAGLLVAGVWGLHAISGGVSAGAVVLLLAAFTALGKGITLMQRALTPLTEAAAAPLSAVPLLVRAPAAMVAGAAGMWWVLRGHAAAWWAHTTSTPVSWTLTSALVQVAVIAVAGALLFGGAKSLAGLRSPASTARHTSTGVGLAGGRSSRDWWVSWWSSRPGLGLMLLAGAAAIVVFSGYIVPRVSGWLLGGDLKAALTAIVTVLAAGLIANTWWWGALSGWWAWAHRPHTPGGGATPMGQMHAGAAVVALLWFSATAFGLAVPDTYTGPGAMPRAHADCPPDCGSNGGSGSSEPAFPMQPPGMPNPPGGYPSGSYPAPDQGNGISIYNPSDQQPSSGRQSGSPQAPSYPQQVQPANGQQPLDYDAPLQTVQPSQPQNTAQPTQRSQQSQAPSAPQLPSPQQQAPQPSQEPDAPQPQDQPTQQPAQQPQQQAQQLQQQNQPCQQQAPSPPVPSPGNNDAVDPTNLAAAATRRGGRQAGQQATDQATRSARVTKESGQFKTDLDMEQVDPNPLHHHAPVVMHPGGTPPDGVDPETGAHVLPGQGEDGGGMREASEAPQAARQAPQSAREAPTAKTVQDAIKDLPPGRSDRVRVVRDPEQLKQFEDWVAQHGTKFQSDPPYRGGQGSEYRLPDGTEVRVGQSKKEGTTVDLNIPDGGVIKLHLDPVEGGNIKFPAAPVPSG